MTNTECTAQQFIESQWALANIAPADSEIVQYLYPGRNRNVEILDEQEAPLPLWYPSGREYRHMSY